MPSFIFVKYDPKFCYAKHILFSIADSCTHGGRTYKVEEHFVCVDNKNLCKCLPNNEIMQTKMGQTVDDLCNQPARQLPSNLLEENKKKNLAEI